MLVYLRGYIEFIQEPVVLRTEYFSIYRDWVLLMMGIHSNDLTPIIVSVANKSNGGSEMLAC